MVQIGNVSSPFAQSSLSEADLEVVVQFMTAVARVPGCAHHLSSALWFLCQHESNRWEGFSW